MDPARSHPAAPTDSPSAERSPHPPREPARARRLGRLETLPRRTFLAFNAGDAAPPQMRVVAFRAPRLHTLGRLWTFARVLTWAAAGLMWDAVRGRADEQQRAE